MPDPELEAMEKVLSAVADLDSAARLRIIRWISEKLDLLPALEATATQSSSSTGSSHSAGQTDSEKFETSLASHIKAKCSDGSQVLRFLVTSDWLRRRGRPLTAGAVAKALLDNQQPRLANPADCLNKNVAKGFCEKTNDGFFVTPEGLKELGYP